MKLMRTHPLFHLSLYRQSEEREHVDKGDVHMATCTKEEDTRKEEERRKEEVRTKGKTGQKDLCAEWGQGHKGIQTKETKKEIDKTCHRDKIKCDVTVTSRHLL